MSFAPWSNEVIMIRLILIWTAFFVSISLQAQESPCNDAVQAFKSKCGPFVGQHRAKMESFGRDQNSCPQRAGLARESQLAFEKICVGAADEARALCQVSSTGGITGASGFTTTAEDLVDLTGTLKAFKDEFDKNNYTGCESQTS